jgi:hypothetical protein
MHLPSEGKLFRADSEPLTDLLVGISKHEIALPNFQRPWVWEPHMVYDLLVSVAYRYPAGSLLTMPVQTASFALRAFEGAGDNLKKEEVNLMILDGQQRLTSLFQALRKQDGVTVKKRTFYFYLNVSVLLSDPDGSIDAGDPYFADALFYVAQEKGGRRFRYDGLQPLYELTTPEQELAAGALPLRNIFDIAYITKWRDKYLLPLANDNLTQYRQLSNSWENLVDPWLDRIRNYPFPVIELRADMPLGAICHIFEKVNSTGVPLDVFDLVTAILWAQGYHLNEEWAKTREKLKSDFPMQPLSGTAFLQGLSLLASYQRKHAHPTDRIAVGCRKQDLMALKAVTVSEWWDVLVEGYREAARFMSDNGILAERILPYSTMIVPLATIFAHLKRFKGDTIASAAWPKIEQWYWCSVFSQRYSSQVEYASASDYEQLVAWVEGGDPPDAVRTFGFRSDYLQEVTSIRNAIYKGILCLLARNGARDFGGGGKLSTNLFYDTTQDHHHIFPTNALKQFGIDDKRGDSVINKTLISASVNRSIGGRKPSQYVGQWREKLDKFDTILSSHAIDPEALASDNWNAFLTTRREMLRQLIEGVCGGNVQPFTDDIEVEEAEEE